MKPQVGDEAPDFALPDQKGVVHRLSDYRGKWVLLYFYPKDDTPGCTAEACAFRDNLPAFGALKVQVLGVSVDSVSSHTRFASKYKIEFPLLADEEKKVVALYGVWGKKKFMGREFMGTNRTSFLIDPDGRVAKVYEKVKPDRHAEEVLQDLNSLGA
ncbi:MAG: thioredoxin-dependent thiol peroxidase [candidate division KSB1 bacterium]|nr:thioredoxin-dependent thiol peroxidase [candidate division KSB1 bacterium]MDZ7295726.1 thioredoxin-dependent thiol peroxidase [candidate division KSB1 bacterium]MDZ7339046.1 thioredoxin-dependent thiol peroxidase [candidate division KSB1 bacterium]MDZ7386037.1 thioredoxin-dependent thiol peroxidase [candidate division KSB1 bacterium]MDZ7394094.1 thioredoxin-dependent thiol peroxidase [candidate division KSB1 bacterium]